VEVRRQRRSLIAGSVGCCWTNQRREDLARYVEGLRKAGLPE
jgi:hypothetical protein